MIIVTSEANNNLEFAHAAWVCHLSDVTFGAIDPEGGDDSAAMVHNILGALLIRSKDLKKVARAISERNEINHVVLTAGTVAFIMPEANSQAARRDPVITEQFLEAITKLGFQANGLTTWETSLERKYPTRG